MDKMSRRQALVASITGVLGALFGKAVQAGPPAAAKVPAPQPPALGQAVVT